MSFHCCNSVSCDILASGPYTRSAIGYDRQVFLGPILFAPAHLTQGDDACHDRQHREINFHWSYAWFLDCLDSLDCQWWFYTETLLHAQKLLHRRFYTQTLLHTDGFTRKHFYTHFYTDAFTHRSFYTQTLLHTGRPMFFYTHKRLYTQTLSHTGAFTHRRFYTDAFTETLLHTDTSTHTLLHTDAYTLHHNFTSVFGDRTSFRAKGLRRTTWKHNFTSVFGDRTSFRAKGLRFVPSRWHCPCPRLQERRVHSLQSNDAPFI